MIDKVELQHRGICSFAGMAGVTARYRVRALNLDHNAVTNFEFLGASSLVELSVRCNRIGSLMGLTRQNSLRACVCCGEPAGRGTRGTEFCCCCALGTRCGRSTAWRSRPPRGPRPQGRARARGSASAAGGSRPRARPRPCPASAPGPSCRPSGQGAGPTWAPRTCRKWQRTAPSRGRWPPASTRAHQGPGVGGKVQYQKQ